MRASPEPVLMEGDSQSASNSPFFTEMRMSLSAHVIVNALGGSMKTLHRILLRKVRICFCSETSQLSVFCAFST